MQIDVTQALRGAGGGKGGGGGGTELPDSLRSTQFADVMDLISEGEIEGLVNGLRSIYLDEVPLQNADGSYNFEGVQVTLTSGTQGQASIAGADGVQSETAVDVAVKAATPVVRTITDPAVDRVRVTLAVPQLTRQDASNGNLVGSSFGWAIDVQSAGGGYVRKKTGTVDGKTTSRYTTSIELPLTGSAPWDIKVVRTTADSTSALEVNEFRWSSFTSIKSLKLRYPNSATARILVDARNFSRVPTRAYDIAGLRVRVPTNYDPIAKTYTGVWDGTFKIAWTDCPAWVFYDAVTHNRYGLGRYFSVTPALKWEMYTIGRYCDELVPDGNGGFEPRFRCGLYLATRQQAYKVITDLAAIFRGMAYYTGSDVSAVQDAPSDPAAAFTAANVLGGKFTYAGASFSKRHSQVVVWFNDPAQFGKLTPEVVVDNALQARIGIKSLELSPLGVWSRGQAQRIGKWVLYSEAAETQTVAFTVGLDGALVQPGKVFTIADPNEAGERLGGRVKSATAGAVQLDAPVTIASGETYTLMVMLPDPANPARLVPQERPVTNSPGQASQITVVPGFTQAPAAETVWLLRSTGIATTSWRCLSVRPVEGEEQFEITGLAHAPEKYALIEQGIQFEAKNVTRIPRVPPAPASLAFQETVYLSGGAHRSRVTLSWPEPAPGLTYLASWRVDSGAWTDVPATSANAVDVDALTPGTLEVAVRSRNALGAVSPPRRGEFTVLGYAGALGSNLIDPTWWKPAAGWEWLDVGESQFIWGVGPRGAVQALLQATAAGTPGVGVDGGWDGRQGDSLTARPKNLARIDAGKTYRFALPVKRVSGTGVVAWATGIQDSGPLAAARRLCLLNSTTVADNPAFWFADLPSVGKWYLIVGYVFPAGSTGVSAAAGGVFDMVTGEKVADTTNYCWMTGAADVATRAFQYVASTGAQLQFGPPTVELVDGTEGAWTAGPRGQTGVGAFTLVASGYCDLPGPDRIRRLPPAGDWDSSGRSVESFVGGAWCSWQCAQTDQNVLVGLNTDAASSGDYASIDYAIFCEHGGNVFVFESGVNRGLFGNYTTATSFLVHYDDATVRYVVDGVVVRTVAAPPGLRLFLDSSFQGAPAEVRTVRFGPAGARGAQGLQGPQGDQGTPGANGTNGANGQTSYFHVAYAFSADGVTGFNQNAGPYIGTYVDFNPTDSASPAAYTWRQFQGAQGAQGTQGIPGSNGSNGLTSYLHLKYSNDGGTTFTAGAGETPGGWLGQYVDFTEADSTDPASYTWTKVVGQSGGLTYYTGANIGPVTYSTVT